MPPDNNLLKTGQRLLRNVLDPMKSAFIGKDEIIDLLGICLVGGENLFMLGPPGTAKSALVHELSRRLEGRTFDYLLTRFTEPNEIFGPFDIARLKDGVLVTNTEGMLPEASLVFLDELLNANSAILNSLLTVLNERIFRRGREVRALPTLMVVGASNRLPEDEALRALFDRFLMRVRCEAAPDEQLAAVVEAGWKLDMQPEERDAALTMEEIRALHKVLPEVDLAPIRKEYVNLVLRLRHAGIQVSDRRAVKLQRLIAASALLCGRREVEVSDLWICRYIWDELEQEEAIKTIVQDVIGDHVARQSHPGSLTPSRSDPEHLARDLENLREKVSAVDRDSAEYSLLRERLSVLATSCHWVENREQRDQLLAGVDQLWSFFGEGA